MTTNIAFRFDNHECHVSPFKYNYDLQLMQNMLV